jgi:hypothetical protein
VKASLPFKEAIAYLIVVLLLLSSLGVAFGWDYYPASYNWSFQNYSYLGFNQAVNFTEAPHQSLPYDISLVGYWNMNEGSGTVAHDLSGNGNNGTINGATWVAGKFGDALSFNGTLADYVKVNNSLSLQVTGDLTLSCWVYFNTLATKQALIFKELNAEYELSLDAATGNLEFDHQGISVFSPSSSVQSGVWLHIVAVRSISAMTVTFYVNGVQVGTPQAFTTLPTASSNPLYIGQENGYDPLNGTIDDVRIYNRALNTSEVTTLYAMDQNPDPVSFPNYYNYQDPATNNTMLIYVDNPNGNSNNVALVTCTNFFADNRLAFQANNSATVNVWTTLGQPVFTTGVWNSQNYTTTLTLDASSTAELNWNTYNITTYVDAHSSVSPSNVTVGYGGSQPLSFNASQGYRFNVSVDGVSQGQISSYTFNNITAPHTVNVVSTPLTYTITASADAHSTITPSNVSVNYGGSQQFNVTADSGYYISHVYVDGIDQGNLTTYDFTNVQDNHTISVTSATSATLAPTNTPTPTTSPSPSPTPSPTDSPTPTPSPTDSPTPTPSPTDSPTPTPSPTDSPTPSPTPTPTPSPTPSPSISPSPTPNLTASPAPSQTPQPTASLFPIETAVIAAAAIAVIAVFAFAFKKGYITIEVVDEENPQENSDDYTN